LLISL